MSVYGTRINLANHPPRGYVDFSALRDHITRLFYILVIISLSMPSIVVWGSSANTRQSSEPLADEGALNELDGYANDHPFTWPPINHLEPQKGKSSAQIPTVQLKTAPLMFIENNGQFDPAVRFQVRGSQGNVYLAPEAVWMTLLEPPTATEMINPVGFIPPDSSQSGVHLRITFLGANSDLQIEGFDPLDTTVSYFLGNNSANWHSNLPACGGVRYKDLYPGIDLEITGANSLWDWRFVIKDTPSISPQEIMTGEANIRLRIEGFEGLFLEGDDLRITTKVRDILLPIPRFETVDGISLPPTSNPIELNNDQIKIPLPIQDTRGSSTLNRMSEWFGIDAIMPLLLQYVSPSSGTLMDRVRYLAGEDNQILASDPPDNPDSLVYSTFIGGMNQDFAESIVIDQDGNAYLTGHTYSPDFPKTPGAFDETYESDQDAFIVKLNPIGTELEFATFLGGGEGESGYSIAIDELGASYVTGYTKSDDFPTIPGSYDTSYNGGTSSGDVFVVKMNPTGTDLVYGTFIGGDADDSGHEIAIDDDGNAYITGETDVAYSLDFPTTPGAFDTTLDGSMDAFVLKLNANGTGLIYSTYLGGSGAYDHESGWGIKLDDSNNAYVAGRTNTSDFPATPGVFDDSLGGGDDGFVAKVNPDGSNLVFASYLGGSLTDRAYGIDIDPLGAIYVTGETFSADDFPVTDGAYDTVLDGPRDGFIVKVNNDGTALHYGTYIGGSFNDYGWKIDLDSDNNAYITGATTSPDFPTKGEAYDLTHNGFNDAFVIIMNPLGTDIVYGTFLGGSNSERGVITLDESYNIYITGLTDSDDFPKTTGAYDTSHNGNYDGFVSKIRTPLDPNPLPIGFLDLPIAYDNFADAAVGSIWGMDDPSRVNSWFDHTYPTYGGSPNWNNDDLTRWDELFIESNTNIDECVAYWGLGRGCYDGHNGLDFSASHYGEPRDTIYAAAPGTVFDINTDCVENQPCNNPYGNYVWVDHGNCYATRYGHLLDVLVQRNDMITDPPNEPVGHMGTTGNSHGVHLHFDLFYDDGCDGDLSYDSRTAIDPYGWYGQLEDPWDGPSSYLWMHLLAVRKLVTDAGGDLISPSDFIHLTIPADAIIDRAWVELWDMPAYYKPTYASGMGSTGRGLWLRVPEWDGASTFQEDLTIQMSYDEDEPKHLHPDYSVIHRWDDEEEDWVALPTTVDPVLDIATAQTTDPGRYELLAPRNIPADVTEPDDDYSASITIPTDGTALSRFFDIPEDEDWFALNAVAGMLYEIETVNLAPGVGTLMELYDQDGFTLLLSSAASGIEDGSPTALEDSQIEWLAPYSGTYFIRVYPAPGSILGAASTYQLVMNQEARVYLPLIQR